MKLVISNLILAPDENQKEIKPTIKEQYGIDFDFDITILRKSLDARNKQGIVYRYRVIIDAPCDKAAHLLQNKDISVYKAIEFPAIVNRRIKDKVLIVGAGPAGLFCALRLVKSGVQVEILERGKSIEERIKDIHILEQNGILNEQSNVLFGEGGAGTFSDGKLMTRINRPEISWIFDQLIEFGASSSILYDAKPHVGTDRLRIIVKNIRQKILKSGSRIQFNESIEDIIIHNKAVAGVISSQGNEYLGSKLVLAVGHSSRDTYTMLQKKGIALERKGFAVGVRIEHPAELINVIQYGDSPYKEILPAADYRLSFNNRATGRGVYTFCMCPGGRIINSSSENARLCVNGMSFSKRDHPFSNSAIVVTVSPADYDRDVVGGIAFQRMMEQKAYAEGGERFTAPAQRVTGFLQDMIDHDLPPVSYLPGVRPADLRACLPEWIAIELASGLRYFGTLMKGFITNQAVLVGVETRTSSPVRITRGEDFQSVSLKGLFPVGEGAGYAGGIVSSAADGIRCADLIAATVDN